MSSTGGTNSGQGSEPDNAVPATADWSGLRDDELPDIPESLVPYLEELRPYIVTDHQGHFDVTGLPGGGWTWEQEDEQAPSRWAGPVFFTVAPVSVGAVVAATFAWGKAGAFGSVTLIVALISAAFLLADRRLSKRVVSRQITLKPPAELRRTAAAAGIPLLETYAQPAPVVLPGLPSRPGLFPIPRALWLGVCAALGYYGVITLARAASMMSAAQHDRLIAITSLLGSLIAVWLLIWLLSHYELRPAKPVGFRQAALSGAESGELRRSLGWWLFYRLPQSLRFPVLIVFLLATGVAVTTSAFYPVPALTSGWRIGTGAFELAGMALVIAVALSRAARATTSLSVIKYLLGPVILLPVAYWLGMLNQALDSLHWITAHLP